MSGVTTFTDEIEQKALEYIEGGYKNEGQVIPSVVGLARYLKVSKSTVYKWEVDGHGTFSDTLDICRDEQHLQLINKGLDGDFNSTITKLILTNHGYSDKVDTDITSQGDKLNNFIVQPVTTDK